MEPPSGGNPGARTESVPTTRPLPPPPDGSGGGRLPVLGTGTPGTMGRAGAWLAGARHRRRRAALVAVVVLVVAAVVVGIVDPFASPTASSSSVSYATTTIKRQTLSSQTQVSATLGYAGTYTVAVPSGTSSQALMQGQQSVTADQEKVAGDQGGASAAADAASVTNDEQALAADRSTLQSDQTTLQDDQATLSADRQKEANDCQGDSSAASSSACSADEQKVSADEQKVSADEQKVTADEQKISQDQSKLSQDQAKQSQDATQAQGTLAADEQKLADDQAALAAAEQQAAIQSGAFSQLPAVGQVISQGQTLFTMGTTPVVLLYGATPATRNLSQGESGPDVAQLNSDLRALGYSAPSGDVFTAGTASAVDDFQAHMGVAQTGDVPIGQVVFLPSAARVTAVNATLGASGQPGSTVLTASSTTRQVTVALDATLQSDVKVGDPVTITLPDQSTTPGVVSYVGTVATTPSGNGNGGGGGGGGTPTIEVDVTPTDPSFTGSLDQAPVDVSITNDTVHNALVVPVSALLALASGGYALEVVPAHGPHYLVPVSTGLFDDADGLVQVTGSQIAPGMRVVAPSS